MGLFIRQIILNLLAVELLTVPSAELQQLLVCALFCNMPVFEDNDQIGMLNRREAVGRDERGFTAALLADVLDDLRFCPRVHGRQSIIQNQNVRIRDEGPGDRDPLLLPPERETPRSPTIVSSPSDKVPRSFWKAAAVIACMIRSSLAPEYPNWIFSRTDLENRICSCGT